MSEQQAEMGDGLRPYPTYVDSDVQWLGRIAALWRRMLRKVANKDVIDLSVMRQLRVTCDARNA